MTQMWPAASTAKKKTIMTSDQMVRTMNACFLDSGDESLAAFFRYSASRDESLDVLSDDTLEFAREVTLETEAESAPDVWASIFSDMAHQVVSGIHGVCSLGLRRRGVFFVGWWGEEPEEWLLEKRGWKMMSTVFLHFLLDLKLLSFFLIFFFTSQYSQEALTSQCGVSTSYYSSCQGSC